MTSPLSVAQTSHEDQPLGDELRRLLTDHEIVSHFQPIVDLDRGEVVAFEALARGPVGSPLAMPGDLFAAAERHGLTTELDWACRAAAFRGALTIGITAPTTLFVNIEPVAAATGIPAQYASMIEDSRGALHIVFELTERALTERPAEMLRAVRHLRSLGAGIALDDVGVDPRSLALMPFLRPDVIKLDMSLVQGQLSPGKARTMHAVNAFAESSGAAILAEGIETPDHVERAFALGSRYGQGWHFGRPSPTPALERLGVLDRADQPARATPPRTSPFERVTAAGIPTRSASKRLLLALSTELETQAESLGPEAVVLANLQHHHRFTTTIRQRYRRLASSTAFVGLLGSGFEPEPEPGIRIGALQAGDPLLHEWSVIVVSPHFAAAMVAFDEGDPWDDDMARRFRYCLTYDRNTVVGAARLMMARMAPLVRGNGTKQQPEPERDLADDESATPHARHRADAV